MGLTGWFIDKSVLTRLGRRPDVQEWLPRTDRGLVRVSTVSQLEVGFSARSGSELRLAHRRAPLSAMPVEYLTPAMEDRAVEVQALLADGGMHRAAAVPDLLIAAAAELAGLTVLHLDKDFDLIAGVTGQPTEWLRTP